MPEKPRASLNDKQARGGVIGGKGYGFQAAYIVSRIPLWLEDPDFAMFLQEGAGDVDVRFDREGGEDRWYVQVKNYRVDPAKAREVFTQFRETDEGSPDTYTRFTLACPGLHDKFKSLRAAVEELRGAASFYRRGQDEILDNTWADLEAQVELLDLPVDATFLVRKVHFDTNLAGLTDDEDLCNQFVGALLRLDAWVAVPPNAAVHVYEKLALLSHRAIRQTCSREEVEALIREDVAKALLEHGTGRLLRTSIPGKEEGGVIHVVEPEVLVPEWGVAAEVRFSITNNSDVTMKLVELKLLVKERQETDDVRLVLAGAPVEEYELQADIHNNDNVDLLKGLGVQFITPAGESEAMKLIVECGDGFRYSCTLEGSYADVRTNTLHPLQPASFTIVYPISSLDTLRARKEQK